MNLQHEITAYLRHCEFHKKLNSKSLKAYSIDLKQFIMQCGTISECDITKATISNYIIQLHQTFKPRTVRRKLASLRAFLNFLEFEEIIQTNPIHKIKSKFQEPKILPKIIPLKFIERLLKEAYSDMNRAKTSFSFFSAQRDLAVVEMLFATGLRVSELCTLKRNDVNLEEGNLILMGKGAKERIIQIGNYEVLSTLRKYYNDNNGRINQSGYFFSNRFKSRLSEQSVRIILRRLQKQAGVPLQITPHMFRHSFATLLLEEDVDIRYIQQMLGHSSIQTTQIYTHVTSEKQRQILTVQHPRNRILIYSSPNCSSAGDSQPYGR